MTPGRRGEEFVKEVHPNSAETALSTGRLRAATSLPNPLGASGAGLYGMPCTTGG